MLLKKLACCTIEALLENKPIRYQQLQTQLSQWLMLHKSRVNAWSSSCVIQQHQPLLVLRYCRTVLKTSNNLLAPGINCSRAAVVAAAGAAADAGDVVCADVASAAPTARRRRRRLFDADPQETAGPADIQQQQPTQQERPPNRRRGHTTQTTAPQLQDELQEAGQNKLHWWQHPAAGSELLLHVFWDLDNLHPDHWNQAKQLVGILKSTLRPYGRLQQLQAYANGNTLVSRVETEGIDEGLELEDELRCPMCGRRCKSFEDLQKHFKQLHEREHQKKMRGPKKFAAKYSKSDKAARVRDAGRLYGTPKKNRSGRKGQMVRAVLQKAGLKVIEVASQSQAADEAINRHVDALVPQLRDAQPQETSLSLKAAAITTATTTTAAAAAAAAVPAGDSVEAEPLLWSELRQLPHPQACLTSMLEMSEQDLRTAWKYLKQMGKPPNRSDRQKLWIKLKQARMEYNTGSMGVLRDAAKCAPRAPNWLKDNWREYHAIQQDGKPAWQQKREDAAKQQERAEARRQRREAAAVAAAEKAATEAAAAGAVPWGSGNALQQSVLVVVSDDRGFAGTVAKWLQRGGAGALLVTTRGSGGWEQPLLTALSSSGSQKRLGDVTYVSWDGIIGQLDYHESSGQSWGESDLRYYDDAVFMSTYGDDPYNWMVQNGFL